jgi:hypothetical protein
VALKEVRLYRGGLDEILDRLYPSHRVGVMDGSWVGDKKISAINITTIECERNSCTSTLAEVGSSEISFDQLLSQRRTKSQPAHVRMASISELTTVQYAMKGQHVRRLQRTLVRFKQE